MQDDSSKTSKEESDAKSGKVTGLRRARPCPICSQPSGKSTYPFCSTRCKEIDLGRWLSGSYAIPAAEEDDPDDVDFADPSNM